MEAAFARKTDEKTKGQARPSILPEEHSSLQGELGAPAGMPLFLAGAQPVFSSIQPQLAVHEPDDAYEQEADRVASSVVDTSASNSLSAIASGVFPDARPREFVGTRLEYNGGQVRIKRDAEAASEAESVQAEAYTVCHGIVFGEGRCAPETPHGMKLLAHELVHVAQQGAAQRRPGARPPAAVRHAGPAVQRQSTSPAASLPPSTAPQSSAAGVLDRYPGLLDVISDDDIVALDRAAQARYLAQGVTPPGQSQSDTTAQRSQFQRTGKTSVSVSLGKLLPPDQHFVDIDIWDTVSSLIQARGGPMLIGGLIRNEITRRFFQRNSLSLDQSMVNIRLLDPEGAVPGPVTLQFSLGETRLSNNLGTISLVDLGAAVRGHTLQQSIDEVSSEAQRVGIATSLLMELDQESGRIPGYVDDVRRSFGDHSLREIQARIGRLRSDRQAADDLARGGTPLPAAAGGMAARFDPLINTLQGLYTEAEQWLATHQPELTDQEAYDETGTALVSAGQRNWEQGNYFSGGAEYAGAALVAVFDGLGNLLTFNYQSARGQAVKAYRRGDISYNEMEDLSESAAIRSIGMGVITVALLVATAGLGAVAAEGLGLAEGSFAFSTVSGGVAGGTFNFGSMTAQTLITSSTSFSDPTAQSIWAQGAYTPGQIAGGTLLGVGLGAGGGALSYYARLGGTGGGLARSLSQGQPPPTGEFQVGNYLITFDATPGQVPIAVGTHATDSALVFFARQEGAGIYRILPDGTYVPIRTVGAGGINASALAREAAQLPPPGAAVAPGTESSLVVAPTSSAQGGSLVPVSGAPGGVLPGAPQSAFTPGLSGIAPSALAGPALAGQPLLLPGGQSAGALPAVPLVAPPTGSEVIADYLRTLSQSGTPSRQAVQQLMQNYAGTLPPPAPSDLPFFDPFATPSGQQPFGLLGPGSQPIGLLGPGPQPFGLLPPGPGTPLALPAGPQPPLQLLPGAQTTLSLRQVLNLRGPSRWSAGEQYIQELYGGVPQEYHPVPLNPSGPFPVTTPGGRFTDVAAPGGATNLKIEVKTYQSWRTVSGRAQQQTVPLTPQIEEQIAKDMALKRADPTFDPRWIFLDAPPAPDLRARLLQAGIVILTYGR